MTNIDKKSILANVAKLKSDILKIRIKKTSGDQIDIKEIKKLKKEVARSLTKLNSSK
ncbi:MAG: 50S ribosomal protein L29 [Alphaproteobacteria bacterium]